MSLDQAIATVISPVIGAVAGLVTGYWAKSLPLTLKSKSLQSSLNIEKYLGNYTSYHLSTADKPLVVSGRAEISKTKNGEIVITLDVPKYSYSGTLSIMEGNMYFTFDGINHQERIQIILNEALTPKFDILVGVFSAVTGKRVPAVGKILWRKVSTVKNIEETSLDQTEMRIQNFLRSEGNPTKVEPPEEPFFDDLPA
jgi:hypothetical protein